MIYSLRGKLAESGANYMVIECGGIGFFCTASSYTINKFPQKGSEIFVYTFFSVREDAMDLYAFATKEELELFKLLTSVNSVGAKTGIAILSEFSPEKIALFIASGDYKALTAVSGIGSKTAQRIVLELKDKLGGANIVSGDVAAVGNAASFSNVSEAIEGLVALGCTQSEAAIAVSRLDQSLSVEELIKTALKSMTR